MKRICSTRNAIRTALLLVSCAAGLMAQSETASNMMPSQTIPLMNLPSQTESGSIGTSRSNVTLNTLSGPLLFDPESLSRPPANPGTVTKSPARNAQVNRAPFAFSMQANRLPSWEMDQPFSNLKYGTAGAIGTMTVHFGQK